jgi:hypothetical protein
MSEVIEKVRVARTQADVNYRSASEAEKAARATVREADAAVAAATPNLDQIDQMLRTYGRTGLEQDEQIVQRLRRNTQSRASRAR